MPSDTEYRLENGGRGALIGVTGSGRSWKAVVGSTAGSQFAKIDSQRHVSERPQLE